MTPATEPARPVDLQVVRSQFPILGRKMNGQPLVFLDSAASSQKPVSVLEAMDQYYLTTHANVHRGVYQLSQEATEAFEQARRAVQGFINAASDKEIIFTRGATEGINLVASSFGRQFFKPGDEIVLSRLEHHSNIVPWQLIAEQTGAKVRVAPISPDGELLLEEWEKLLNERTKMVAVAHVSNSLGSIFPVEQLIAKAHERDIPVLLDGAQAIPHLPVDVQALDVDFYVFSAHKMYGPTGIGALYGKEKWLDAMPPYHGGGEMIRNVTFEKTTYNDLPFKFEAGTPDMAGAVGLEAAIRFMEGIGLDTIRLHDKTLLDYATEKLLSVPQLRIFGNALQKTGAVSFLVGNHHPYDVGALLDQQGIAVRTGHHCTQPLMDWYGIPGTVRASFGIYNNLEDIDRLVAGVERAARMLG